VVAEEFSVFEVPPFAARFNIAPTQPVPVIRMASHADLPKREFALVRWGLIPSWAKDAAIGNRMINARSETVATKPAFRAAFRRRRCLVAADGFYEWQRTGKRKQPYLIRVGDDRPFAMAGLWESWEGAGHEVIESCTILTTEPNELMRPIHDRMPVILPPDAHQQWLDPAVEGVGRLAPLLRPYPADAMTASSIGTYVNRPTNEGPQCIEPERDLFS